jgi:hypothetical protein
MMLLISAHAGALNAAGGSGAEEQKELLWKQELTRALLYLWLYFDEECAKKAEQVSTCSSSSSTCS